MPAAANSGKRQGFESESPTPQTVAKWAADAENPYVEPTSKTAPELQAAASHGPFDAGVMVLLALGGPREKFWGQLLALSHAGVSLRGIDLESFDDSVAMIKAGEPFTPATVFFPMHRVERMELDVHAGGLPSLSERFRAHTGSDPVRLFGDAGGIQE